MNKPFLYALAMFTAVFGATLARSYFTHGEIHWLIELVSALGIAVIAYSVAQWKQQKAEWKSESDD